MLRYAGPSALRDEGRHRAGPLPALRAERDAGRSMMYNLAVRTSDTGPDTVLRASASASPTGRGSLFWRD